MQVPEAAAFVARAGRVLLGGLLLMSGCNTAPPPSPAVRGKAHFENYCTPCHGPAGLGKVNVAAPSIAGLPQWYVERQLTNYRHGFRGSNFEDLEGYRMAPMARALPTDRAVTEVAAYVAAIPFSMPEPTLDGDAGRGSSLYATCSACHGADGLGNELLGSPPLTRTHDWYLLTQLKKFKGGVRAYSTQDTWGSTMVPMARTLPDEQAMKDVVAHIQTLRK